MTFTAIKTARKAILDIVRRLAPCRGWSFLYGHSAFFVCTQNKVGAQSGRREKAPKRLNLKSTLKNLNDQHGTVVHWQNKISYFIDVYCSMFFAWRSQFFSNNFFKYCVVHLQSNFYCRTIRIRCNTTDGHPQKLWRCGAIIHFLSIDFLFSPRPFYFIISFLK